MATLNTPTPSQPAPSNLPAELEALRHLIVSILILTVVISGTLNIYLLRQWRSTSKDLAVIRPQAAQMLTEFQKVSGPLMNDFMKKVTDYAQTHPDFLPILSKYGIKPASAAGVPPTGAKAPAPATAPKK